MSKRVFNIAQTWCGDAIPKAAHVEVCTEVLAGDLHITIDAPFYDEPRPSMPAGPTDKLWNYEVVELFLVAHDGQYLELEFGPHGHYLMLWLTSPRVIKPVALTCTYQVLQRDARWTGQAIVSAEYLPTSIERVNAFAISGLGAARQYLAWHPLPGTSPDFHQPAAFKLW